jgi:16S rRNA (cytosine967-C5)-methyltransferase
VASAARHRFGYLFSNTQLIKNQSGVALRLPPHSKMKRPPNSIPTVSPARLAAFEILRRVEEGGAYAAPLLAAKAEELNPNDRALSHELVMGVLRRQLWLDRLIAHFARRDPQRLDVAVRIVLRLGLYQLRFLTRIPSSAAVNEAVNLVRLARLRSAQPFVNAVLRNAARTPNYNPVDHLADPTEKLAVETSHPPWLLQRWIDIWGTEETTAFAHANNEAPPLAFRIINEREQGAGILNALKAAGGMPEPSLIARGAWRITGSANVVHQFASEGRIYVQDEGSQLVAHVLDARPGERVLDVCAAPGSKTTHIAELTGSRSMIVAGDLHAHRLRTIRLSAVAQGLGNIRLAVIDGQRNLPFAEETFDRVLVDAPCTGTGTLRRNPEIRWRISQADLEDLAGRQLEILLNAARLVKPGGRLVYSTCSIEPEENEQVASRFMEQITSFEPEVPAVNPTLLSSATSVRIWPHKDGADGFFISAFRRR